ncbi:hypothetical protein D3C72_2120260 [compost metagenome]
MPVAEVDPAAAVAVTRVSAPNSTGPDSVVLPVTPKFPFTRTWLPTSVRARMPPLMVSVPVPRPLPVASSAPLWSVVPPL